jgi:hypothetical protein
VCIYIYIAGCPQCCCGEIRQILIFLINIYCPKACHGTDHSIRIVEYHKTIISLKPNIFNETRTQDIFRVCDFSPCHFFTETNKFRLGAPHWESKSGHFSGVLTLLYSLLVLRNKHAKFGSNRYIRSRAGS